MTIALVLIAIIAAVMTLWWFVERDPDAVPFAVAGAIAVLVVWALIAWPMSAYKANKCQDLAEGYGLDRSDWSIRLGCRVYLPTGQLVPEDRIRITSDGQIVVAGDE